MYIIYKPDAVGRRIAWCALLMTFIIICSWSSLRLPRNTCFKPFTEDLLQVSYCNHGLNFSENFYFGNELSRNCENTRQSCHRDFTTNLHTCSLKLEGHNLTQYSANEDNDFRYCQCVFSKNLRNCVTLTLNVNDENHQKSTILKQSNFHICRDFLDSTILLLYKIDGILTSGLNFLIPFTQVMAEEMQISRNLTLKDCYNDETGFYGNSRSIETGISKESFRDSSKSSNCIPQNLNDRNIQMIDSPSKQYNKYMLFEGSTIDSSNKKSDVKMSNFSKYSLENYLKGNCNYYFVFENLYKGFNYSQELLYNDFTTVDNLFVNNSSMSQDNSKNFNGLGVEAVNLEAKKAIESDDHHRHSHNPEVYYVSTEEINNTKFKINNNIEIHEPKSQDENQIIKKLQNLILHNIQNESGSIKIESFSQADRCKGNETCLKDLKIVEHLRAVDSILEWIFENANLLAGINICVFLLIILITYKGSKSQDRSTIPISEFDELRSYGYSELSKEDIRLVNAPRSARLKATQNLEIDSEFNLEKSEKSQTESFVEIPRKISNNSTINIPKFPSSEDLLKASKIKQKQYSPKPEALREFKISFAPSFAKQIITKHRLGDGVNSPIIEEKSCSVSPATSFKKLKSAFAKTRELQLHEEYIKTDEGIVEIKTQKCVTIFEPNPKLDTLVSEYMNQQDPSAKLENNFSSYHSFKNISQLNLVCNDKKDNDFEDKSFCEFTKKLHPRNKSINFYIKSKKTKSFKEDDKEYFCASPIDEAQRTKSKNKFEFKTIDRPLTDYFDHKADTYDSMNESTNPRSKSVIPLNAQKSYEVIGRVKKSSKTNFLKKEREESIIVQNKDEIVKENKLRECIKTMSRHQNNSNSDSANNDTQFDKIQVNLCPRSSISSERVKEISSNSEDQHAHDKSANPIHHSKINKFHSIFVRNNTQLSCISSKENEEDKNENEFTLHGLSCSKAGISTKEIDISQSSISRIPEFDFGVNDSPNHESCIIETDFNAVEYNNLLDKYLTKSSPLYKHLSSAHSSQFKLICPLGKGGFGSVMKAVHILDNNIYAIKNIKLHLAKDQDIKCHKVFREVQMMTKVNHKNVVRYYTCWLELASEKEQMTEEKKLKQRFSTFSKHSKKNFKQLSKQNIDLSNKKIEISEDSSYMNRSPSGYSNMKSGDSIEWEQGSCVKDTSKSKKEDTNNSYINKYDSIFDEESKNHKELMKDSQSVSEDDDENLESSRDTYESIVDYIAICSKFPPL